MKILTFRLLLLVCFLFFATPTLFSQPSATDKFIEGTVSQYISCSDEVASGTVTLHYFYFYNSNGKVYRIHIQPQGAKLIGEKTGTVYNAVGVTQSKETFISDGEAKTSIYINNFHLVGVGKDGEKYKVHLNIGYTVNANGEITADFEHASMTCQ